MITRTAIVLFISIVFSHSSFTQNLTIFKSEKSVDETASMIVNVIKEGDLIFFETVNHDEIASTRGVSMKATRSILFEDPDLTTTLINCQQTAALDLPLEILVWEENGDVYIGFIDPKFMVKRFMIQGCDEVIIELSRLMVRVTTDAMRQL
jgi:uncharacterized protein (DUF302 family)